jgi:hypothetical protein
VAGAAQNALDNIKALPSAQNNVYLPSGPTASPEEKPEQRNR